jgi:hypothetical protein
MTTAATTVNGKPVAGPSKFLTQVQGRCKRPLCHPSECVNALSLRQGTPTLRVYRRPNRTANGSATCAVQ